MFLEIVTILMLFLVILLKYGVVARIVKLNQRLRDIGNISQRHEAYLERRKRERKAAEREETGLARKQVALENEVTRLESEWRDLKEQNLEVLGELLPHHGEQALKELNDEEDPEAS